MMRKHMGYSRRLAEGFLVEFDMFVPHAIAVWAFGALQRSSVDRVTDRSRESTKLHVAGLHDKVFPPAAEEG